MNLIHNLPPNVFKNPIIIILFSKPRSSKLSYSFRSSYKSCLWLSLLSFCILYAKSISSPLDLIILIFVPIDCLTD
jgi:hypothetical protein